MTKEQAFKYLQSRSDLCHVVRDFENEGRYEAIIDLLSRSTVWTPCTEKMPTEEDAFNGHINVMDNEHMICSVPLTWLLVEHADDPNIIAWSRIEQKGGGNG